MKPLGRKAYLDKRKKDHKVFEEGVKIKNWWEDICSVGQGKQDQELHDLIKIGIEEYREESDYQLQEDLKDYNKIR
jgi:hypothetical protein